MDLRLILFRLFYVCQRIICIIIGLPLVAMSLLFHLFTTVALGIIGIPIITIYYIIDGTLLNYWMPYLHNWIVYTEWIPFVVAEYMFFGDNKLYLNGPINKLINMNNIHKKNI